ncbi:GNAT family N-acetyltransferase [Massilia sp. W12]|uniref:GNAT family N-acetyltransferase n=1 Tax=Massilia sp. W12 TaxID=3126507 RepID=UPI0030D299DB
MPVLQSARLDFELLQESDAAFFFELVGEPGWIAGIGDKGFRDLDDARREIREKYIAKQAEQGFSLYRISLRADGSPIGLCGLVSRPSLPHVDLGYALLSRYTGQGYAQEAALAVRDFARDVLQLPALMGIVNPENRASQKVLEKTGMRCISRAEVDGKPTWTYLLEFSTPA